jgi:RNA polymerase sigma factor (sigma-70 family)
MAAWTACRSWDPARGPLDKYLAFGCRSALQRAALRLQSQARGYRPGRLQWLHRSRQTSTHLSDPVTFDCPSADPEFSLAEVIPAPLPDTADALIRKHEREAFDRALNRLSADDQLLLRRTADGWMDKEIAAEDGVSHQAISQRRERAVKRLRKTLNSIGESIQ